MAIRVGGPSAAGRWTKGDHDCHLSAFIGPKLEQAVDTSYGTSDAAMADVLCVDCLEFFAGQLIFGAGLVPALTGSEEPVVCGILGQGKAKANRSAPWVLDAPTPEELDRVQKVLDQVATERDDGVIVVDTIKLAELRSSTELNPPKVKRVQASPPAQPPPPPAAGPDYDEEPF